MLAEGLAGFERARRELAPQGERGARPRTPRDGAPGAGVRRARAGGSRAGGRSRARDRRGPRGRGARARAASRSESRPASAASAARAASSPSTASWAAARVARQAHARSAARTSSRRRRQERSAKNPRGRPSPQPSTRQPSTSPPVEINVIGQRVEEALEAVERALDQALVLGRLPPARHPRPRHRPAAGRHPRALSLARSRRVAALGGPDGGRQRRDDPRTEIGSRFSGGHHAVRARHQRSRPRGAPRSRRHRRGDRRPHAPEEGRTLVEGALPVSQRTHAVLHRRPRQGSVPLLRMRRRRRRDPLRPPDRPPRVSRGGGGARRPLRSHDSAPRAPRPARRPARPDVRGRRGRGAFLPRAPRQAGQPGREVSRAARRPEGALEGADARTRAGRLGLDRPGALPRVSGGPPRSRRASSSRARRAKAPTTASATGSSSFCATNAGAPVGFGGRALSPEGEPKYLNSPESPIFSKKRLLYGLFQAREAIRKHDRVVLVEGYFDHLALLRAGVAETVASMGTALTPEQAERLRRLTGNAIVCYDGDAAGRNATRGALTLLLAQGFEARVARLPADEDPDDLLRRRGTGGLAKRIDEAPDFLTWLLEDIRPDASRALPDREARADREGPRDAGGDPGPDPPLRGVPEGVGGRFGARSTFSGGPTRRTFGRRLRVLKMWGTRHRGSRERPGMRRRYRLWSCPAQKSSFFRRSWRAESSTL